MQQFIDDLKKTFEAHRNPEKAVIMSKYMRDHFPFLGIAQPDRKTISKPFLQQIQKDNIALPHLIPVLWNLPEREYHYFCMDAIRKAKNQWEPGLINEFERMILQHSWWDSVDVIASNITGPFFKQFPGQQNHIIHKWRYSSNIWLKRATLLFQLNYKATTDQQLLFSLIRQYADHDAFFIRKAIGWALREYAKTDPEAVLTFVEQTTLKNLSKREALKHFQQPGK